MNYRQIPMMFEGDPRRARRPSLQPLESRPMSLFPFARKSMSIDTVIAGRCLAAAVLTLVIGCDSSAPADATAPTPASTTQDAAVETAEPAAIAKPTAAVEQPAALEFHPKLA